LDPAARRTFAPSLGVCVSAKESEQGAQKVIAACPCERWDGRRACERQKRWVWVSRNKGGHDAGVGEVGEGRVGVVKGLEEERK
jgi:hypothetical protein